MRRKITDILIDYETLNNQEHCTNQSAVLELGAVAFHHDPENVPDFNELKTNAFRAKFDLASQKGIRVIHKDSVLWWKQQSDEAKLLLKPSDLDISVTEGHKQFVEWLKDQNVDKRSQIWCRGNSFDFPILYHCLHEAGIPVAELPKYYKQRDVRTRIEAMLGVRDEISCPLPLGTLDGFVHHSGIDDCAKDVLMLIYSARYAFGLQELPDADQCEPSTIGGFGA